MSRMVAVIALGAMTACSSPIPDSNPNANRGVGFGTPDDFLRPSAPRGTASLRRAAWQHALDDRAIASGHAGRAGRDGRRHFGRQTRNRLDAAWRARACWPTTRRFRMNRTSMRCQGARRSKATATDLARQRAALEVASPEAIPERPRGTGPNIVAFALSTSNPVGQRVYSRSGRFNEDRYRRACAKYGSGDQAQAAFLEKGGPERDREGLDPGR